MVHCRWVTLFNITNIFGSIFIFILTVKVQQKIKEKIKKKFP